DQQRLCDLSGVSTRVIASIGRRSFDENLLITHRGFSGPAILQISSYWKAGTALSLDLAPQQKLALNSSSQRDLPTLRAHVRTVLPQRLSDRLLDLDPPEGWTNHSLEGWEDRWHHWSITPDATEGYDKAEVTAGGIDTSELSAKTMESRIPGLFFIGEVVDVTGHLGGFNFQWAWASGAAAGRAI
ncbi:MAG TPA: NAD(P)/FAD-dependent oxidoreductase, partial [Silvibacterium sp.]|nr:NAD(P)/FAD-dependent oxidoreductase [Silvibacterium sp.]